MRCVACNVALSSAESVRKFASGAYTDLCSKCLRTIEDDVDVAEDSYEEPEEEKDN